MRLTPFLLCIAATLLGCTSAPSPSGSPVDGDSLGEVLCAAVDSERAADAKSSFAAAHDGLHTLARDLQAVDERAVAARLLEAKQRVEAAVAEDLPLSDLSPRLAELVSAVSRATDQLDRPPPPCD